MVPIIPNKEVKKKMKRRKKHKSQLQKHKAINNGSPFSTTDGISDKDKNDVIVALPALNTNTKNEEEGSVFNGDDCNNTNIKRKRKMRKKDIETYIEEEEEEQDLKEIHVKGEKTAKEDVDVGSKEDLDDEVIKCVPDIAGLKMKRRKKVRVSPYFVKKSERDEDRYAKEVVTGLSSGIERVSSGATDTKQVVKKSKKRKKRGKVADRDVKYNSSENINGTVDGSVLNEVEKLTLDDLCAKFTFTGGDGGGCFRRRRIDAAPTTHSSFQRMESDDGGGLNSISCENMETSSEKVAEMEKEINIQNRKKRIASRKQVRIVSPYFAKTNAVVGSSDVKIEVAGEKGKRLSRTLTAKQKGAEAYKRRELDNNWIPPRSPFNLLQEEHAFDPWRVLVICMFLNVTTGQQAAKVISEFFQLCPNAKAATEVSSEDIINVIRSLGLYNKRSVGIQCFSQQYMEESWTHVTQLFGVGKYAADAYAIFCTGKWREVKPICSLNIGNSSISCILNSNKHTPRAYNPNEWGQAI